MAAAAYAFLVSLLNTMDMIPLHYRLSTCFDIFQFQSLREKVDFLVDFVENHSNAFVGEDIDSDITQGEALLSRIAVVAQMAEDKIEVEAAEWIRYESTEKSLSFLYDLENTIRSMDSIMEEVTKMKEERLFADRQHTSAMDPPSSSSSSPSTAKKTTAVVGFNGYLERVLDELTGYPSGRRILPIVGMGGIGKTTLARTAYEHSLTLYHFDVRVWVTVSQTFSVADILSQALSCLGASTGGALGDDDELGDKVHKLLFGRRYLIVLDDMWSIEAWERIKFFFPDNDNRSRILVTTRQGEVVDYFASSALAVDFLDRNDSWELFCGKAFAGQCCPPELEEMGRKIVEKCRGFPLAIGVIGGLLSKSPRTQQYWEEMAKDRSFAMEKSSEGNKALSIIYLSYKHLPPYLKPCFLHLGLFPEDHRFEASYLVKLWVAEGFIKPKECHSLEQVAQSYIKELEDRNLLLVGGLKLLDKEVAFYRIHDLVRELCINIGEKEQFYSMQRYIDGRFYPLSESLTSYERPSVTKPLKCGGKREAPFKSRLLRVLVDRSNSPIHPFQVVNLRFFFRKYGFFGVHNPWFLEFPSSISMCWTLQTLIISEPRPFVLPPEIWKMPQLRHIEVFVMHLPDPPLDDDDTLPLLNLQTLKRVENLKFNEEVCKIIPNIKELWVEYDLNEQGGCFSCLNNLEMLSYEIIGLRGGLCLVQGFKLPSSLKALYLLNCHLGQCDMAMIASLPHLETLSLYGNQRANTAWDCVEGEFIVDSLKHLVIDDWVDLENWAADSSNFPLLEALALRRMHNLKEIPSSFGEISTLENLWLYDCSESATMSAINIQQEQEENLGNLDFHLTLNLAYSSEPQFWPGKIQEFGITSQNIHVEIGDGIISSRHISRGFYEDYGLLIDLKSIGTFVAPLGRDEIKEWELTSQKIHIIN